MQKKHLLLAGLVSGFVLVAAALYVLAMEISIYRETGEYSPLLTGAFWYGLSPGSLNFTQAIIQRYLFPQLWDPVIVTILLWPAWAVFGIPGLALLVLCRRRRHRHGNRR